MDTLIEILKELKEIKSLLISRKKILNLEEFCAYTGISKSYAYHLTSKGKIKCYKPFKKLIFFNMEDVHEFLTGNPSANQKTINTRLNKYLLNNPKN